VDGQDGKLLPVKVKGKWGFINHTGEIVIRPQYNFVGGFSEGFAAVSSEAADGKCGYISHQGEVVIDAKFDFCGTFNEGFAVVEVKNMYGYINKNGSFLIQPRFKKAWAFSEGVARFASGELELTRYGFIDQRGDIVIKPKFVYANDFHGDLALAAVVNKKRLKVGFLDKRGEWKIKPHFGSATDFSEGHACVTDEGASSLFEGNLLFDSEEEDYQGYYINKDGKKAFEGTFKSCGNFSEGLAPVEINEKWYYINNQGQVHLKTDFSPSSEPASFSEGLAAVNMAGGVKFIDRTGKTVIETAFDWADNFVGGIARIKNVSTNGVESYGYIDKTGNVIWKPTN
jgi:hypothetical protein